MTGMGRRVLSAVVGVPVLLVVFYQGGWLFFLCLLALSWLGQYELWQMFSRPGGNKLQAWVMMGAFGLMLMVFLGYHAGLAHVLALYVLVLLLLPVLYSTIRFVELGWGLLALVYPALFMSYGFFLREMGFWPLVLVFVLSWVFDISAFLAGSRWGQHKVFPRVSPNKSLEGLLTGLVVCGAVSLVFVPVLSLAVWQALISGLGLATATQVGDLAESALKRWAGVKDAGSLIPGHGGVLDRFDGVFFSLPMGYALLTWFVAGG